MGVNVITSVGHRGAAGLSPENTLAGFQQAMDLGVDAVECDVHVSADGRLVVMHDATVDRTTNGTGALAEMSLDEIRRLDAGDGQPPPTLEQLLDLTGGHCGLYCELKADGTEALAAEAVARRDMVGEVLFISFAAQRLANIHEILPSARASLLVGPERFDEIVANVELAKAEMIGVHHRYLCPDTVTRAAQAGLAVGAWTPNTTAEMAAMIAMGVDSITTDFPDRLLGLLRPARP
jgi:glycerophosphoryl diester phosphodiesterase